MTNTAPQAIAPAVLAEAARKVDDMVSAGRFPEIEDLTYAAEEAYIADDFALAFALDNMMEHMGGHGDSRVTCWTCQSWANENHVHDHLTGELLARSYRRRTGLTVPGDIAWPAVDQDLVAADEDDSFVLAMWGDLDNVLGAARLWLPSAGVRWVSSLDDTQVARKVEELYFGGLAGFVKNLAA